jgi:hypothetical protein
VLKRLLGLMGKVLAGRWVGSVSREGLTYQKEERKEEKEQTTLHRHPFILALNAFFFFFVAYCLGYW